MNSRRRLANAIRALSMDAVEKANSGHPGAPMGMADIAEVLWRDYLVHNPSNPGWPNRDRFILSNGHGSMLLYSLLHLTGYDLDIEEIKNFRQLHSKTPGHPEYGCAPGVETTTGPLGQGLANGVGMAIAEKVLAAKFNRVDDGEAYNIVDHRTYVFVGDGCLMEGVSHEVASLAGTLGLGKLICIYDDNGTSIDGEVAGWFTDDTVKRFESYAWQVIPAVDGHDREAVSRALDQGLNELEKPTLICCKTKIGYGSPNKAGTAGAHGSPLGEAEVTATRQSLGWDFEPFEVPSDIYESWNCRNKGEDLENKWRQGMAEYRHRFPELADEYERRIAKRLPDNWDKVLDDFIASTQQAGESIASRKASQKALDVIGPLLPELLGGSADLTGSNCTSWSGSKIISRNDADGNYINFGVREFGMSAITNGIALHGGLLPYSGTFLIFMEYGRNAVRMSALMGVQNIFVYTHDSIGQGEDGPTHQPIEQLSNLRATPNMSLWRPCDAVEAAVAWRTAIERRDGPTSLIFTRQTIAHQNRSETMLANISKGAYVLKDCSGPIDVILIATGSEVEVAMQASTELAAQGIQARVVSMPSADVFEKQDNAYRQSVIPDEIRKRISIEAGHVDYWRKWVGLDGCTIGMRTFGESAPGGVLMKEFGFIQERVVAEVKSIL